MNEKIDKQYNSLFIKFKKLEDKNYNELSHIIQDKIYRKFIKDICNNNNLTLADIKKIAFNINKNIVKYDKNIFIYNNGYKYIFTLF